MIEFLHARQYTDAESGLIYVRARFYDPSTGQFMSRDPLVAVTEQAYGYVGSNPVNGIDPLGLSWWKRALKIAVPIVAGVALVVGATALTVGTGGLDLGLLGVLRPAS